MRLDLCSWLEVEAYLQRNTTVILPTGSTEQHGPMGLIGTDALCAGTIARLAGERTGTLVAPTLAYTPAPFNTAFPGTISVSAETFRTVVAEIMTGLYGQGFRRIYVLNGHGANLEPIRLAASGIEAAEDREFRLRSWWEFEAVGKLRTELYGDWEGMHATPSEVAITQATHRVLPPGTATQPPRKLSADYIRSHAGDRHGPPDEHRRDFPDGRVGSHSALARPEHGTALIEAAVDGLTGDLQEWLGNLQPDLFL
ncbi:creatininase family protein [Roseibium sp.]|uniref:creatininase family protein n=1 Tax=Roseibium sp. TaxID=1936156 RepID=UPI003BAAEAA2